MYIITYTSYHAHNDKEVYQNEASALYRFDILSRLSYVTNLKMRKLGR